MPRRFSTCENITSFWGVSRPPFSRTTFARVYRNSCARVSRRNYCCVQLMAQQLLPGTAIFAWISRVASSVWTVAIAIPAFRKQIARYDSCDREYRVTSFSLCPRLRWLDQDNIASQILHGTTKLHSRSLMGQPKTSRQRCNNRWVNYWSRFFHQFCETMLVLQKCRKVNSLCNAGK